ncbi:glycosyltransferase [Phormidium tenue FACHB-886]|nr:glycosyltransferase [Phormidium tenue FACHB-886]
MVAKETGSEAITRFTQHPWFHPSLLLLWVGIGAIVRFTHLTAKPPWTDEFATLVFGLGHSFESVPLDRPISLGELMQPLQLPPAGAGGVLRYLLSEDVHPPFYFVVANAWMRWFSADSGLVSLGLARSLPAWLGVASIPAMFGLSWLLLRSIVVSQLAAAMMALSPFGVYLAQEARHYTIGILWVIASLCCFVVAVQRLQQRRVLPLGVALVWIGVNGLGIATHYFFMISLAAMTIALAVIAVRQAQSDSLEKNLSGLARWSLFTSAAWRRIGLVMLGTAIAGAVWLPVLKDVRSREITQWIQNDQPFGWLDLINPIVQSIAAWATMLVLLPLEADSLAVAIGAGVVMVAFIVWAVPKLYRGLRSQWEGAGGWSVQAIVSVVIGAIALFFLISYGLRTDLTRGARYSFVYFPAVVLLLGVSLAGLWQGLPVSKLGEAIAGKRGKTAVLIVLLFALVSSFTVVNNLGYRKYYRPDVLVPLMQSRSQNPVWIVTTYQTLVQTGEMMGLGWQFLQNSAGTSPQFLLARERQNSCEADCAATVVLQQAVAQHQQAIDLWLVNFHAPVALEKRCVLDEQARPYASGYGYRLYHCN